MAKEAIGKGVRILFVNSIQESPGAEIWTIRTMLSLQERGHAVRLCCRPGTALAFGGLDEAFPVDQINFRGDLDPLTIARFAFIMWHAKIDVVLTHLEKDLSLAGVAARVLPRPVVVLHRHGVDKPVKRRRLLHFAYKKLPHRIIVHSEASKKTLLQNSPWLREEKIEVIYQGIDPRPFEQAQGAAMRREWGIGPDVPLLGFVGPLDERKGIGVLLTAFDHILAREPQARLVFIGEGPLREMIESEVRSKGWQGHVHVAGFIADIPSAMRALDVLILPSFIEGFSSVLIEAMAAQLPVISTRYSSMPEVIVDAETGFLVPPGDSEAIASRAICLLQDAALRLKMGEQGFARVKEQFSIQAMLNHLEAIMHAELKRLRR